MAGRVFKRGTSWTYVIDVGQDTHNNRRQQWRGGFETKREAERALREVLHALDREAYVPSSRTTIADYLRAEWLPAVKPHLRPSTWIGYGRELELNVIPTVGNIPLQQLNAAHLNRLYAYLLTDGRKDGNGGLSTRSVRYVHTILQRALSDAMRWGLVERNVAALADPPRQTETAGRHIRTWTSEELRRFLDHVRDERLFPAWLLHATTGMRRGEVLGLRWVDVDLPSQRLAVRKTLVMVGNEVQVSDPKTKRSVRTIDLDTQTVSVLTEWKAVQEGERDAWGTAWKDNGLVFTREDGSYVYPDGWTGTFERYVRLHDLRHTHATQMLSGGINPKIVSERLGHHSTAFTLDTYVHVIPGLQRRAAQQIADELFDPRPQREQSGEIDLS
jgi:integrase